MRRTTPLKLPLHQRAGRQEQDGPSSAVQLRDALRSLAYDEQVQLLAPGSTAREDGIHQAAAHGVASGGGALPHLDRIQASFGRHDISGVRAHTGPTATEATCAMGAHAYATGNDVVLGPRGQDLHTVAHEAAHVVQQRAGVSLKGGVGQAGDAYEKNADAVADAVVAGRSAEELLDETSGDGATAVRQESSAVQRRSAEPAPEGDGIVDHLGLDRRGGEPRSRLSVEDGPRFRAREEQEWDHHRAAARRATHYDECELENPGMHYSADCIGPYDPSYGVASDAVAANYAAELRNMGIDVRTPPPDHVRVPGKEGQIFRVQGGPALTSLELIEAARALLRARDGAYTPERVAQIATECGQWYFENYRIYPNAGRLGTVRHKDEPAPSPFGDTDWAAAGLHDAGRRAKAFVDPVLEGMKWTVIAIGVAAVGGPYLTGTAIEVLPAFNGLLRAAPMVVEELGLFKVEVTGGMTGRSRAIALAGMKEDDIVHRFFNTYHPATPADVRQLVAEIAKLAR